MQVHCTTHEGHRVTLRVASDKHGTAQVYLHLESETMDDQQGRLCHGWGVRRMEDGFREGVLVQGGLVAIPREAWLKALQEREELRDRQNLPQIHLVKVYSRGDRITLDGYALSARVHKAAWKRIAPHMVEVDSSVNEKILEGDHFIGWLVKPGKEKTVEEALGVKRERTLEARSLLGTSRGSSNAARLNGTDDTARK